jgi:eukaryotic-like serine/threonine-protein kinase
MKLQKLLMPCVLVLLLAACAQQGVPQASQTEAAQLAATTIANGQATLQVHVAVVDTREAQVSASQTALAAPTATGTFTPQPTITPTVTPTATPAPIIKPKQTKPLVLALAPGVSIELVRVPAGEFIMGSTDANVFAQKDEKPQHTVYLDEYLIGKTEVTVAQFRVFMQVTGFAFRGAKRLPEGQDNYPITGLYYEDALAFTQWLSEWTGHKVSIPTEAQWEKAARSTDGRLYPWGATPIDCNYANVGRCNTDFEPVGSHPQGASFYGALDMIGNAPEICSDFYLADYYQQSPNRNPTGPATGIYYTLRGGCFATSWGRAFTTSRLNYTTDLMDWTTWCDPGLRVVVAAE